MRQTIILTRHTTTSWNRERRIQGQTDIPLDDGGKEEARALAIRLAALGIQAIVSSDLIRARETAEIIRAHIRVPFRTDPRIRECSFGKIEGMTRDEAIARHGTTAASFWDYERESPYDFRPFGGEHREGVLARHRALLADLPLLFSHVRTVLLVGHGRGLNTLLMSFGRTPDLERGGFAVLS